MKKILFFCIVATVLMSITTFAYQFSDLSEYHWAYEKIALMQTKGIISGFDDGTFRPESKVTREQFAKLLVRTFELKKIGNKVVFEDVDDSRWSANDIQVAADYLTGYRYNDKLFFKPSEDSVREDVAVAVVKAKGLENKTPNYSILDRFSDKDKISDNLKGYVAIAVEYGIMKGNADGTFNPLGTLTRAEAATLLSNSLDMEKIVINDKDILKNIKYDPSTGIIDFGENYSELMYYISYTAGAINGDDYIIETEAVNALNEKSARKYPTQRYLSVYTKDLGSFAGVDCYVPFVVISLREDYNNVIIIDTRKEAEDYLRTKLKTINKEVGNDGIVEIEYSFNQKIRNIEVYVENGKTILSESHGLDITLDNKKCIIKFRADEEGKYKLVVNATYLSNEKAILKPFTQSINVIKKVEETIDEDLIKLLSDLNIDWGYSDGTFRPEVCFAHCDAVALAVRTLNLYNKAVNSKGRYDKLPKDYWANGYYYIAIQENLFDNLGEDYMVEQSTTTYRDFLTLMINVLGYNKIFGENDPVAQAIQLELLSGVDSTNVDNYITRGDAAKIIENTLNTQMWDVLSKDNGITYGKTEKTLREIKFGR